MIAWGSYPDVIEPRTIWCIIPGPKTHVRVPWTELFLGRRSLLTRIKNKARWSPGRNLQMGKKFDLVFEGGGAKGLAHVGAMHEFYSLGHEHGRLVGTSSGAMTAGLIAAGFSSKELQAATQEKVSAGRSVFSTFMDVPETFSPYVLADSWLNEMLESIYWSRMPDNINQLLTKGIIKLLMKSPHFRQVFSLIECGGSYSGDALYDWLHNKLNSKGGLGDSTFAEFREKTNSNLTVLATDTTGEQVLVLNHRTAPNCPVTWAIRMSMNLPLLWQEVLWETSWGLYQGTNIDDHAIVDGGLISNFALNLLVSDSPAVQLTMGKPSGDLILGLLLDESLSVPGVPDKIVRPQSELKLDLKQAKIFKRITRTLDTITGAGDRFVMSGFEYDICRLPVKGFGTTEFDMSRKRINALVAAGKMATKQYFAKRK